MELKTFKRLVGAGLTPLLGSDTAPVVLNKALDNIYFANRVMLEGGMLQRLAVTYHYTGAGPAPDVAVDAYLYDSVSKRFTKLTRTTLTPDVLNYIDFPAVVEADPVGAIAPGSAEIVLVPIAAGGEPDGTYEFSGGFDAAARQSSVGIGGALPLPTGAATALKQDAQTTALNTMAEGSELAPANIAVQVYNPPLRWIHNYGATAGTVTFKSKAGGTARPVYLAQGATLSVSAIQEVTAFTAGMTMTGGY